MSDRIRQTATALDGLPAAPPARARALADGRGLASAQPLVRRLARLLAAPEVLIGVAACAAYLPIAARTLILGPDAVEYLDVGRRLAAGDGFMLGIKAFHFGGTDVLHHGLAERPPLFPILIAGLFRLGFGPLSVQVVNAVLTGLSVTLVAVIGRQLFGREVGLLAALLTALSPLVLERMIWPMTEALAISLSLLGTWLVMRVVERPSATSYGLAGLALGLAYLARPTVLALVGVLGLTGLLLARDRRQAIGPLAALAGGVALAFVPISVYSALTRGSIFYSGQTYLYALYKDPEVMEYGFNAALPNPGEFIRANPGLVVRTIGETFAAYGYLLFAEWELLLPLALAWPAVIWALARRRYPRAAVVPLAVALTNFVVYGLTWSTFQDRYLLLTMLLLLPFAIDGLRRTTRGLARLASRAAARPAGRGLRRGLTYLVVGLMVAVWAPHLAREYRGEFRYGELPVGTRKDEGLVWTAPPRWIRDGDLPRVVNWINTRTAPLDVLAHAQPWPFTFFTGRPATLLPLNLTDERLRELVVAYRVDYVLLDTRDRDRRRYVDALEKLGPEGVTVNTLGSYRIFDVRSLRM
jgi:4-amino-4-deoxy-L-arabinose transferase-like glycosyltransferase